MKTRQNITIICRLTASPFSLRFFLVLFLIYITFGARSQAPVNYPFPKEPGNLVQQIISITYNNTPYIVSYSIEGLTVHKASDLTLVNTLSFTYSNVHGRFSPLVFDRELWPGTMNYMVYDNYNGRNKLYVVSPQLNIYELSVDVLLTPGQNIGTPAYNKPSQLNGRIMDGSNSLKYDYQNQRLFWLCGVKSPDNAIGNFHKKANYFAVFDISGLNWELIDGIYVNSTQNYTETIFDFEYTQGSNSFKVFLAQKGNLKTYEYTKSGSNWNKTNPFNVATLNGKFSKLLSFTQNNSQHIAAFPYRLPFSSAGGIQVEPEIDVTVMVTWFPVSNPANIQTFPAPSKRVTDACFDNTTNSMLMTFAPYDIDGTKDMYVNQLNRDGYGKDLYVYSFGSVAPYFVNNNGGIFGDSLDNMNYPLYFSKIGNEIFLCKKDELVQVKKDTVTDQFIQQRLDVSRAAFFMGALKADNKYFVLNTLKNGIDVYNGALQKTNEIGFGKPVFHIMANPMNRTYYLFHNLLTENPGLYAVNMDNPEESVDLGHLVDKPIGDMVYNPFTGDMLISENNIRKNEFGKVLVLNKDNNLKAEIEIPNAFNCSDMFISPSGYLYVLCNAHSTTTQHAFVSSFNAVDYTLINADSIFFQIPASAKKNQYISAYFEHNATTGHDYIVLGYEQKQSEPYTTERYSTYGFTTITATGAEGDTAAIQSIAFISIFKVLNGIIDTVVTYNGDYPKDMVFIPAQPAVEGDYDKLVIRDGDKSFRVFNTTGLSYDTTVNIVQSTEFSPTIRFMEYDAERSKLYVLMDEPNKDIVPEVKSSRQIAVYEVTGWETNAPVVGDPIFVKDGHAAGMMYNRFDRHLYVYYKGDHTKEANTPARLYKINPDLASSNITPVNFPYLTMESEVYFKKADLYPDPYTNRVLVVHGGHCNISTVDYTPHEVIPLQPNKINWISFPRLRLVTGQNYATLDNALNNHPTLPNQGNIQPQNIYNTIDSINRINNNPPGEYENNLVSAQWSNPNEKWEPALLGITEVIRDRGYKLNLHPKSNLHYLHLAGALESPIHEKFLYATTDPANPTRRRENWTGYWLYEEQDIFDALGAFAQGDRPAIAGIKHQDWSCVFTEWSPLGGWDPLPPNQGPRWYCSHKSTKVKYGDMVVLRASSNINDFRWYINGQPPYVAPDPGPVHYSYTLKADYTPIVIALDTTSGVTEIGAFVNDTCVGASVVQPGDTVVVLNAYMDGLAGDSVYFEQHSPMKSLSEDRRRPAYSLMDNRTGRFARRGINPRERREYYVVSFMGQADAFSQEETQQLEISAFPNPAGDEIQLLINIPDENPCQIVLLDLMGRQLFELHSGFLPKGSQQISLTRPPTLPAGLYLLKATAGQRQAKHKLIIK